MRSQGASAVRRLARRGSAVTPLTHWLGLGFGLGLGLRLRLGLGLGSACGAGVCAGVGVRVITWREAVARYDAQQGAGTLACWLEGLGLGSGLGLGLRLGIGLGLGSWLEPRIG